MPQPDLTALVLSLTPAEPTTTPAHLGRASYALLMRLIAAHDAALARQLHDDDGVKPFTCSTLIGGRRISREQRQFQPEKTAWLRFTGLNTAVSAHLQRLAENPPEKVELDGHIFQVTQATLDAEVHPWAGQTSYETLAAPYLLADRQPDYRPKLLFASPTTFRSQGKSQPIPLPDWVFGSLADRWNAFSPVQISPELRRFAAECVVLNHYRLRTKAIPFKENVVQMGCVGQAGYVAVNRDRYWASMLNLLVEFSFFGGVGYQTTMGLGQARRPLHLANGAEKRTESNKQGKNESKAS